MMPCQSQLCPKQNKIKEKKKRRMGWRFGLYRHFPPLSTTGWGYTPIERRGWRSSPLHAFAVVAPLEQRCAPVEPPLPPPLWLWSHSPPPPFARVEGRSLFPSLFCHNCLYMIWWYGSWYMWHILLIWCEQHDSGRFFVTKIWQIELVCYRAKTQPLIVEIKNLDPYSVICHRFKTQTLMGQLPNFSKIWFHLGGLDFFQFPFLLSP